MKDPNRREDQTYHSKRTTVDSTYMPVPDRSGVEWRAGPVFMVMWVETEPMNAGLFGEKGRRSDRVLCVGRDWVPNDDVPRGVRRATLARGTLGKGVPRFRGAASIWADTVQRCKTAHRMMCGTHRDSQWEISWET
ncbi:hypothetical protein NDU88_002360 [Pleurodeles waltl]|uniref:Uncharacterized protein n=1 Tax=Pleurodeles waltl TaxID=8319 RepID=A0AAV7P6G1_PLEWA|nr:hypothetical protein NDU88_002360 [Pleurodeles waltl]